MKSPEQFQQRYARQIALPEIGEQGQCRLSAARVLLVGAGGLGSPAGLYLTAAGVGRIGIVDSDSVDISNLQRQIVHTQNDIGRPKVISSAEKFRAMNPDVIIDTHQVRLTASNVYRLLADYDFVIDATDNFESKFLIADACHLSCKPYCHAGIDKFYGLAMTVLPGETACYRCVFEGVPDALPQAIPRGPIGALPGILGSVQALEAIKWIIGCGQLLTNRLFIFDGLECQARVVNAGMNPNCLLCGKGAGVQKTSPVSASPRAPEIDRRQGGGMGGS